ncbi:MAG: glycosyltransferase family 4 protein [Ignavibacteria bacterium]|nr:glycosyltransferase family 4 protein [Ignavibacteria bacterium]
MTSPKGGDGRPVVINATNLGCYLDGIGTYTFNLLRELTTVRTGLRFIVYVNRTAAEHLSGLAIPDHWTLKWVSPRVSPDNGFKGHLLRFLLSNLIGLRHPRSLIVTASQLEAIFFRSRQVVTIHDVIPLLFRECHRKQYFYFRRLLPFVLRKAQAIITPSRHTKGLLEQIYNLPPEKIKVIPNGVRLADLGDTDDAQRFRRPFILFTGRIVRMKNITGVLRAFGLVQNRIPHALVIAGHGRERMEKLFDEERLREYGIDRGRVHFAGHVSFEQLASLLRSADALVFPSFYEGFGLPPLEAMKAGCPAIVSRAGSLPEVCENAAYYVDPYDTEGIARGIHAVISDARLRARLIRNGFERAARFSWVTSARQHLLVVTEMEHRENEAPHPVHMARPAIGPSPPSS